MDEIVNVDIKYKILYNLILFILTTSIRITF